MEASIMHRFFPVTLLAVAAGLAIAPAARAQSALLDLPRESQHAQITQKIGLTNITISYHRPLAKGRQVFGKLEPYGKVWRAGANENTTIEFSDPVTVEGKALAAGVYGLHMIPGESEWTVIFSKTATAWGSFSYDQKDDALRVTVKSQPAESHEALTYDFDDPKPGSAVVTLRWDKTAVPFKVEVNTHEIVQASLHKQLVGRAQYNWDGWDDAATYLADQKYDLDEALKYEDRSIQVEERFDNLITKARVLDLLNRKDDASKTRVQALTLANAIQLHVYGRQLQQQGKQDEAFDVYRSNIKKNPNHWLVHNELARLAVAKGDYDTAVKEMKLAAAGATDGNKPAIEGLVKRLENKEDINK
jgi:tetratricopeptide (TPR) repeat protein